jgi:hypothetical protein
MRLAGRLTWISNGEGTAVRRRDSMTKWMEELMSKRELIEPHSGDKRYVRRDRDGQFKESVDVGDSLAADRRQHAATKKPRGEGDKGD